MITSGVEVYCLCFSLLYMFDPSQFFCFFFLIFSKSWAFATSVIGRFLWRCWTHKKMPAYLIYATCTLRVHFQHECFFPFSGSVCPHLTKYRTQQGLRPAPNPHFDWIYILINIWCLMNGVSGWYFGRALVLWMQGCNYIRALWSRLSLVRLDLLGCIKRRPTTVLQ